MTTALWQTFAILTVAYVPGALLFRLPTADRSRRAALSVEERLYWNIVISGALSSVVGFGLAWAGHYAFNRLLWIDGSISLLVLLLFRQHLRLGSATTRLTWTALIPAVLLVGGLLLNFAVPPAEYVIGGKDPGVYMSEGIRIAQRGSLIVSDDVARTIPPLYESLFFPKAADDSYFSSRFMGFFVLNQKNATVVGQFLHLYPVWIAIAYGINGLSGAREVAGVLATLGLLAVYSAGARIVGRPAAAAGAGLLAINVVQLWYSRYPNAEILMQPLVFAGLLAYVRACIDNDGFFAPVAALLLTLAALTHLTGTMAAVCIGAASLFSFVGGRRQLVFLVLLVLGLVVAGVYLARTIPPYFDVPREFILNLRPIELTLAGVAGIGAALLWLVMRGMEATARLRWILAALTAATWTFAAYAFYFRAPTDVLAVHDADSLRMFSAFYLSGLGLAAALIGFALLANSASESALALLVLAAGFSFAFFYKIRIVPEHFWAARRFVAVILPSALLLVGMAAFGELPRRTSLPVAKNRAFRVVRRAAGLVVVLVMAVHFWNATRPILHHVEYAGLIPHLEEIANLIGDRDLLLVESRGASDSHVLALPLAYIYARNVLVFARIDPDKATFRGFLSWAREHYQRVLFAGGGGGGTELLSRTMTVKAVRGERFQVPEYESALNAFPRVVKLKEFDLSLYEFLAGPRATDGFALDVGSADDLYVRRFHAKEQSPAGFSYRWTRNVSFVSILGTRPDQHHLTIRMSAGGRPPSASPAAVEVFLNDQSLGSQTVVGPLQAYYFVIPPNLAATIADSQDAAQLRLVTNTWSPRALGAKDDRDLGVMVDSIEVR